MDIGALLDGSTIAITGGTGTLGQALVKIIRERYHPHKVVIMSRGEARQAAMKDAWPEGESSPMRYFIGDVRDERRLIDALAGCKLIVHAAALKRVEVCEREPEEALQTNVMGTRNLAWAAREVGAERVLFISSDKACQPITTYGATKYLAERLIIGANNYRGPRNIRYSAVRYGNVLGSTGSVLHTIREANGKFPLTHPDMGRFWWTPEDAAKFVLSSLAIMRGGEVFVPKLPAMKVMAMVRTLKPDMEFEIVGMRGPEKLQEIMLSADESPWVTELSDRYVLMPTISYWPGGTWPESRAVESGFMLTSATVRQLSHTEFWEMQRKV